MQIYKIEWYDAQDYTKDSWIDLKDEDFIKWKNDPLIITTVGFVLEEDCIGYVILCSDIATDESCGRVTRIPVKWIKSMKKL
jgi:mannosyltransferase OCH1-like enzyme